MFRSSFALILAACLCSRGHRIQDRERSKPLGVIDRGFDDDLALAEVAARQDTASNQAGTDTPSPAEAAASKKTGAAAASEGSGGQGGDATARAAADPGSEQDSDPASDSDPDPDSVADAAGRRRAAANAGSAQGSGTAAEDVDSAGDATASAAADPGSQQDSDPASDSDPDPDSVADAPGRRRRAAANAGSAQGSGTAAGDVDSADDPGLEQGTDTATTGAAAGAAAQGGAAAQKYDYGNAACPCLGLHLPEGSTAVATIKGNLVAMNANVLAYCNAWESDENLPDGSSIWCQHKNCKKKYCYIDPCNCDGDFDAHPSHYFTRLEYRGRKLFFSYTTCGETEIFTDDEDVCRKQQNEGNCTASVDDCSWNSDLTACEARSFVESKDSCNKTVADFTTTTEAADTSSDADTSAAASEATAAAAEATTAEPAAADATKKKDDADLLGDDEEDHTKSGGRRAREVGLAEGITKLLCLMVSAGIVFAPFPQD
eukprot:TRINITY_DN2472_c0_g1_i3.p1 TRINITY_DN2472_c0_g1~~TRINITY_DN2472_c0_g1_i3.p1  ORF type:complete len:489 (-),score=120.97 TRINITY_DN2472_c0_g1_i3:151-1617(-)